MRILSDIHFPSSSVLVSQFQRIVVPLQADSVSQLSGIRSPVYTEIQISHPVRLALATLCQLAWRTQFESD